MRAFDSALAQSTVFDALIAASKTYGAKKLILEDQERNPLSYTDLIRAAFALGRKISGFTARGERVGVMLPSSSGGVVTFFALHAFGRVPTMLNFTAGIRNLKAACELAGVKTVLTSHRFVEQGKLRAIAVSTSRRNPAVPNLPAVSETAGLEKFESDLWYGFLAPAKTPAAIIERLNAATRVALARPEVKARFEPSGTVLVGSTPAEFATAIRADIARWGTVISTAKITPEY